MANPADDSQTEDAASSTADEQSPNAVRTPSDLDEVALFNTLSTWFRADRDFSQTWRTQAKEDFNFVAGEQWQPQDRRILEDQGRPVIVFNRTLPIIKSVAGIEINSRENTIFLPAVVSDGEQIQANATLNAANTWMSEGCDAESEQSQAFQDSLVCGIGCTEQRVDYDEIWDGKYQEDRIYPVEMYWDMDARKPNLKDAKRVFRLRKMTLAQGRLFLEALKITGIADEDINATWAVGSDAETQEPRPVEERRKREENATALDPRDTVHLVHAQWIEHEDYFKVAVPGQPDPQTGQPGAPQLQDMTAQEHDAAQAQLAKMGAPRLPSLPCRKKVYKQAILGSKILGEPMPVLSSAGFTWTFITGEQNAEKGQFFGIVSVLRDPQRWANKWLSQTMHILNSTAKGGILAEEDAFEDIREAQLTYPRPDAITAVRPGAISKGKIMEKPGGGMPAGFQGLLEFSISSIRDVSGVNLELLGMRDNDQVAALDRQKKQTAMTILATTFDSLRGFRRLVGRNRLSFIQDFFSNDRLVRIRVKAGVYQGLRITQDKTAGDYEVIVSEAPNSPDQKEKVWASFQEMMPILAPYMQQNPEVALTILEYSPLPSEVVEQLRTLASQPNPQQQKDQALADAAKQAAVQKAQADIQKTQADVGKVQAQTILDRAKVREVLARADHERSLAIVDLHESARDFHKPDLGPNGKNDPGAGR